MKKVLLPILLALAASANAANYYVDNAATGANNGTSWANAWQHFASMDWNKIAPGDTIFLSGGTQGKIYGGFLQFQKSGTKDHRITVRAGQDPGHTGPIVLDGGDGGEGYSYVKADSVAWVTLDGFVNGKQNIMLRNFVDENTAAYANKVFAAGSTGFTIRGCLGDNINNFVCVTGGASQFLIQSNRVTNVRGDAFVRGEGCLDNGWDTQIIEFNYVELAFCTNTFAGSPAPYIGPDGVQGSHGLTIRYNTFTVRKVGYKTSFQHPDYCQIIGNHVQIYGNEFIDIGDSGVDLDWRVNPDPHDIWIFNNLFRITEDFDPYPEYIRWYASYQSPYTAQINSVSNLKIINNTFVDNKKRAMLLNNWGANKNPKLSGVQIVNNVFVNGGAYSIEDCPALQQGNALGFQLNSYDPNWNFQYRGATYSAQNWVGVEPSRVAGTPKFMRYTAGANDNDYHLDPTDTIARNNGINLANYFNTDKDGNPRSPTARWDLGCYNSGAVIPPIPPPTNNPPPLVSGPAQPANVYPANNAQTGFLNPNLTATPYVPGTPVLLLEARIDEPINKGTTTDHADSEFTVFNATNGIAAFSGSVGAKTNWSSPVLPPGQVFTWTVRYKDTSGRWSTNSPATTFRTAVDGRIQIQGTMLPNGQVIFP